MAEQYAAVLNNLLSNNAKRLVGTKVVYWYIGDVKPEDDPMRPLFGDDAFGEAAVEDEQQEDNQASMKRIRLQAENRVAELLDSIRTGKRPELQQARFCALTLSGNAGRVVVRDWMEGQFEDLVKNVDVWFKHTAIVARDGNTVIGSHKLFSILAAPVRESKEITCPLEEAIWRSAIKCSPIPYQVMAQTLSRIRNDIVLDESARHARLGLLKAYCNRNERMPNMTEKLNPLLKDSAYLSGRILALLADIQYQALGDVGAGIVQRYYAAASATPGLVLGRLVRLANMGHLPKIKPIKLRQEYIDKLAQIWKDLEESPPATLTLEKQTLFAMGYYQQKAKEIAQG
jgi:CRISPR-associated protein Csd1